MNRERRGHWVNLDPKQEVRRREQRLNDQAERFVESRILRLGYIEDSREASDLLVYERSPPRAPAECPDDVFDTRTGAHDRCAATDDAAAQ